MAGVVVHVLYDIFVGTSFYKNRKAAAVLLNSYWNVSDILSNLQSIKRFERNSQVI